MLRGIGCIEALLAVFADCGIVAEVDGQPDQGLDDPFEEVIEEVLSSLPANYRSALSNVAIIVEDEPTDGQLLGLYRGVPHSKMSWNSAGILPSTVSVFRGPITRLAADDDDRLRREIRQVVLRELGRHFGID